jgi:hypothetical protein
MIMSKYNVIVPNNVKPKPEPHEIEAAEIIGEHFKSDVKFVKRGASKSADIEILKTGEIWEIKSPTGKGKHNIQHNVQAAAKQSANIALDARRSKLHQTKFKNEAKYQFQIVARAKKMLIITKTRKVLEIVK